MSGTEIDPVQTLLGGDAATDAQQDAILRELDPPQDESREAPEPRAKPAPQAEAPEPTEEPEAAQEGLPAPAKEKAPEDPAFERAVAALRRDGYSGEDIHSLSKPRVIALGQKAAKRQDDVQAKLTDRSQHIQKVKELEETLAKLRSAEPASPPIEDTLIADLKPLDDEYGDGFGSKLAKVMAGRERSMRDEIANLKKEREEFQGAIVELRLETARGRVGERFPSLREAETWEKVVNKVTKIWPGGDYPSFDEAILDAAKILDLEDRAVTQEQETTRKARGQPTGNGRKARPAAALSPEEHEYQMLLEIESEQGYAG